MRDPRPSRPPVRRLRACVEAWPDCAEGEYHPSCCRFPKSCSATVYDEDRVRPEDLEDLPEPPLVAYGLFQTAPPIPPPPRVIRDVELYDWGPDLHGLGTVTAAVQQTLASSRAPDGGTYAHVCRVCRSPYVWTILREGDTVVSWACDEDLAAACFELMLEDPDKPLGLMVDRRLIVTRARS